MIQSLFKYCDKDNKTCTTVSFSVFTFLVTTDLLRLFHTENRSRPGVDNSFGFAGHIRDKLGTCGPVHVLVN